MPRPIACRPNPERRWRPLTDPSANVSSERGRLALAYFSPPPLPRPAATSPTTLHHRAAAAKKAKRHRKEKKRSEALTRPTPVPTEASRIRKRVKRKRERREDADGDLQRVQRGVRRRGAAAAPLPLRVAPLQPQAQGMAALRRSCPSPASGF